MPLFNSKLFRHSVISALAAAGVAFGAPQQNAPEPQTLTTQETHAEQLKADAYYHVAMGHLYEEMAVNYGNRADYANKAIENYRAAMKEDPSATFLVEDIAELYRATGRIREAVEEAQAAIKANPDELNARRVLARIYTQEIGDAQTNHIDENMAHRAIDQYRVITQKDPKDTDSLIMLGRLDRLVGDSVGAEQAFKAALNVDGSNEDAATGLAAIYSDRNDPQAAADVLKKVMGANPTARELVTLASSYEQMKQYAAAAEAYQKAIELDPSRPELKAALAQDLAAAGQYDQAIATYQELANAAPQEPMPYLGMAQIYREQHKYQKAEEALNKAKSADPDNVDIQLEESHVLDAEGKTQDAIELVKNVVDALNRKPGIAAAQKAEVLDWQGTLYRNAKQYDKAIETFHEVAQLDSDMAAREAAQVIDTYRTAEDYQKAFAESEAAYAKYPTDRIIVQEQADALSEAGQPEQAVAVLKKLLDGSRNDSDVHLALADVYERARNFPAEEAEIDAAEKLAQNGPDKLNIEFKRGSMYEREKKYDLAEKQFRAVLETDPNNAGALNYLGYMFADQGVRLNEAQDLIKRAVNLEPNNYAYLDSLGWVDYKLDQLNDAEQELRRSVEIHSTDPTIHDHLGDVLFKQGKLREAIAQWQSSLHEWDTTPVGDKEPEEIAKVQRKLDDARVRLAREQAPTRQ